jgi:hypothetical protein
VVEIVRNLSALRSVFKYQKWIKSSLEINSRSFQNLKQLIQNSPSDANETLLERMKKFIVFIDEGKTSRIFLALQELEDSFPYVGR